MHFNFALAFVCLLAVAGQAQQTANKEVRHYSKDPNFHIPVKLDDKTSDALRRVILHVSEDGGRTFRVYETRDVERSSFAFRFKAEHDGVYKLVLQAESKSGEFTPPKGEEAKDEGLIVCVDTIPPKARLKMLSAPAGEARIEWEVSDENLDLKSLKLEWRQIDNQDGKFETLDVKAATTGQCRWRAPNGEVTVRLHIGDLAGNTSVVDMTVAVAKKENP